MKLYMTKDKTDAIRELWKRADGDANLMKVREVILALVDSHEELAAENERLRAARTDAGSKQP